MTTTQTTLNAVGLAPILTVNNVEKSMRFYEGLGFVASHEGMKLDLT